MTAVIATSKLSKWYGNVLGLSDVTLEIEPGITGLLGPNGAGKSTFLKLITGQIRPSIGTVHIFDQKVQMNQSLFSRIGYCPEHDSFYEEMTGWVFLTSLLKLEGLPYEPLWLHVHREGYAEAVDPSVFVRLPLVDEPGTSLLVWTTTPWTLPGNVAVAVHPQVEYVTVERALPEGGSERLVLARPLLEKVFGDEPVRVVDSYLGK